MRLVIALLPSAIEFTEQNSGGAYPYLKTVGALRTAARAGTAIGIAGTESSSVEVTLDNSRNRRVVTLIGRPLRFRADIYGDDDALLYSGTVASVKYGEDVILGIEA
jgi:hypothetical protein